ncbi:MAG: hypothetical protein ACI9BD_001328 [Candidatus Marinamargulisbacteria bacterium]|jgi:hypothetical protein
MSEIDSIRGNEGLFSLHSRQRRNQRDSDSDENGPGSFGDMFKTFLEGDLSEDLIATIDALYAFDFLTQSDLARSLQEIHGVGMTLGRHLGSQKMSDEVKERQTDSVKKLLSALQFSVIQYGSSVGLRYFLELGKTEGAQDLLFNLIENLSSEMIVTKIFPFDGLKEGLSLTLDASGKKMMTQKLKEELKVGLVSNFTGEKYKALLRLLDHSD